VSEASKIRVLIAEDESGLADLLASFLTGRGYAVVVTGDGRAALDELRSRPFDVALLDLVMPGLDGLEVLRQVRDDDSPAECIIITGSGTIDTAISAMRLGAYDYVGKPYRMAEIDALVRRAAERRRLSTENRRLSARLAQVEGIPEPTSVYAPMQAVLAVARRVAETDAPVLITGEAGSGKSALARYLHANSPRADGPLVEASCAAIPAGRIDSELFGNDHRGEGGAVAAGVEALRLIAASAGGTFVIEDVGELEPVAQAALAEVFMPGGVQRMAGRTSGDPEVRIVATTSADLATAVRGGAFRADLLAYLSHASIVLPSLRERAVDIPHLARAFLRNVGGARAPTLAAEALEALGRYPWPGNLRELRNVLERAFLLSGGGIVHAHNLPFSATSLSPDGTEAPLSLAEVERRHIAAVLQRTNWHQGRAAQQLGISAKTLYRKIREYGFERPNAPAHA